MKRESMRKAALFILTAFFATVHLLGQEYFGNGSFEYGRDPFWYHHCESSDAATFSLSTEDVMDGSKELHVSVTKKSANENAIYSSTNITLSGDSIYLLRFWAHGKERKRIKVSLIGETTRSIVYEMRPGRILFNFPFKSSEKDVEVKIYYLDKAGYYLDGFEVLTQNNDKGVDVLNTYIWNNGQVGTPNWVAGDNDVSYRLPDGRTLWFFNDSFIASENDTTNNALYNFGSFVRNAMVVEDTDGKLHSRGFINQGGQSVYFPVQDTIFNNDGSTSNFYWVGDALLEDGKVKVYLVELKTDNGAVATTRSYLAELSYPELELLGIYRQADFCYGYETFIEDHDTIYLFKGSGEGFSRYMHVARTPVGNLMGYEPWEYWNGTDWSADESEIATLLDMDPSGVIKLEDGSFAAVSLPVMGDQIDVSFAPAPEGPWTAKQKVFDIPHDSAYWWYMPNMHNQLPNGNYSISYSTNAWYDLFLSFESFEDKYWYRPRYIQVDLLDLSPYSEGTDCAGITNGSAYLDDCGNCVGGTTGMEPCVDGTVLLYSDCDMGGTEIGIAAGEYSLAALEAAGYTDNSLSSLVMEDGYETVLYDEDDFGGSSLLLSESASCLEASSFNDLTTSLVVRRTGTENLSGTYVIQNAKTGLVMSSEQEDPENFTKVIQDHYWGYEIQQFTLEYIGANYYNVRNLGSDKLINIVFGNDDWTRSLTLWDGQTEDFTEFSGKISAQYTDSPTGQTVTNLVDNNSTSKFMTFHMSAWVKFSYDKSFVCNAYALTSSGDVASRDPKNWALRASNDGVNWVTLDTLSDQVFEDRYMRKVFTFDNEDAYSYYKLDIKSGTTGALAFNEWEILNATPQSGGYDSHKFVIQDAGDGSYRFINKGSDMVLEIADNSTEPGVDVRQMPDYQQESRKWLLLDPDSVEIYTAGAEFIAKDTRVLVYPNPAGDFIRIQAEDEFTGGDYRIYSVSGSIVLEGRFESGVIDISALPDGFYLLQMNKEGNIATARFIRQ